ncbi:MAG: hypothetical protein JKY25_12845 [Robiginitomaculum sp.]|nr:hypothetical protein [Robiginitomaculum sp.]
MSIQLPKTLTGIGSVLLVITALFHISAITQVTKIANAEDIDPFVKMFIEPLWVFPTMTWLITAILAMFLVVKPGSRSTVFLSLLSLIPLSNAGVLFLYTGPFIGGFMLLASGIFILLGALTARAKAL